MRSIQLVAFDFENRDHREYLYRCSQQESFSLCTVRNYQSIDQFVEILKNDFIRDRKDQVLIRHIDYGYIGTLWSYSYHKIYQHIFVSTFIEDMYQNCIFGVRSFVLFCAFLFEKYELYKIYLDVYDFNKNSLSILSKKFALEGRFKNHVLKNGERFDLCRFALYGEIFTQQKHLYL